MTTEPNNITLPATTTETLEREIARLHHEIAGHARSTLENAIRIGRLLTEKKASLRHGEWADWLKQFVPFSQRSAIRYMHIYDRRKEVKLANVANLTEALRWLSDEAEKQFDDSQAQAICAQGRIHLMEALEQMRRLVRAREAGAAPEDLEVLIADCGCLPEEFRRWELIVRREEVTDARTLVEIRDNRRWAPRYQSFEAFLEDADVSIDELARLEALLQTEWGKLADDKRHIIEILHPDLWTSPLAEETDQATDEGA